MSNRRKLRGSDWEQASREIRASVQGREDQIRAGLDMIVPGFLDQVSAAAAEGAQFSEEVRRRAEASDPARYHEADGSRIPQQIADQVQGLYLRVTFELAVGERRPCPHVSIKKPCNSIAPVYGDWIRCVPCYMSTNAAVRLTEQEEHTCDLCGTYEPEQPMDAIFPQVGPVMLIIGVCPACRARITAA
jgi:hypothetical protein